MISCSVRCYRDLCHRVLLEFIIGMMLNVQKRTKCTANVYESDETQCGVLRYTCPAGGDPSLSGSVAELRLALAEGELHTGLDYRWWTHGETIREVRHLRAPGWKNKTNKQIIFSMNANDIPNCPEPRGVLAHFLALAAHLVTRARSMTSWLKGHAPTTTLVKYSASCR